MVKKQYADALVEELKETAERRKRLNKRARNVSILVSSLCLGLLLVMMFEPEIIQGIRNHLR